MNIFLTIPGCISPKGGRRNEAYDWPWIPVSRYRLFTCLSYEHKKRESHTELAHPSAKFP